MHKKLKVIKIYNHNLVLCLNEDESLFVLGKGIGFGIKKGGYIDTKDASNIYKIKDIKNMTAYEKLIQDSDKSLLFVCETIIQKMSKKFNKNFDEKLHISLLDHIKFSIKRYYNDNLKIKNIFNDEIKYMYPDEYKFSLEMLTLIKDKLDINLPISEAGFICMHIHCALYGNDTGTTVLSMEIIKKSLEIIEKELNIELQKNTIFEQRLITHLKFAIKRSMINANVENPINDIIKEKYEKTYKIALKIKNMIKNEYDINFYEGEIGYLTVHIQNILENDKELITCLKQCKN